MRTPEQVAWDFVQQWLDKARKDLEAARALLEGDLEDYENVGQVRHAVLACLRPDLDAGRPGG